MTDDQDNPCIGICMIGPDGYCEGCGRHVDEIHGPQPHAPGPHPKGEDKQPDGNNPSSEKK